MNNSISPNENSEVFESIFDTGSALGAIVDLLNNLEAKKVGAKVVVDGAQAVKSIVVNVLSRIDIF